MFEVECIDRMYLNVYQPLLQHELGLIGFRRGRLGCPVTSTAPLAKVRDTWFASITGAQLSSRHWNASYTPTAVILTMANG